MNVEADSGDDVEELPTSVEGQSNWHAEKRSAKSIHMGGKKKKGGSLSEMTKAIKGFTEVSRARLNRSIDTMPQSREFFVGG